MATKDISNSQNQQSNKPSQKKIINQQKFSLANVSTLTNRKCVDFMWIGQEIGKA